MHRPLPRSAGRALDLAQAHAARGALGLGREERRRDVALAGVGQHDRDPLALGLGALRDLERGVQRGAAGDAGQHALAARGQARGLERVLVVDGDDLVEQRAVEHRRHEARADALDLVRAGPAAGEHGRGRRLDGDHLQVLVALLEEAARAGDRAAGADAGDEVVDPAVERLPQLRAGGAAVRLGVGGVGELVGQPDVAVARHRLRGGDGLVHAAHRLGDVHLGAVEAQQPLALAAHALREREDQVVALGGAHERERDAGVAARGLDDRGAAGLDAALGLGGLDHRHADAVLDRAARVEHLELGEDLAAGSAASRVSCTIGVRPT